MKKIATKRYQAGFYIAFAIALTPTFSLASNSCLDLFNIQGSADSAQVSLASRLKQSIVRLFSHDHKASSTLILPDGSEITGKLSDGNFQYQILNTEKTQSKNYSISHGSPITKFNFSQDGSKILTASFNGLIKVTDTKTGQELPYEIKHNHSIDSMEFTADQKFIVTLAGDRLLKITETSTGRKVSEYPLFHNGRINSAKISQDGNFLVTASSDGTANVYSMKDGRRIYALYHNDIVYSANFSNDGKFIVTASRDGSAKIFEMASGREVFQIWNYNEVYSAGFSSNSKYVFTFGSPYSQNVKVVDLVTGKIKLKENHSSRNKEPVLSPDGKLLMTIVENNRINIYDIDSGKWLISHEGGAELEAVNFNLDSQSLITIDKSGKSKTVKIFN